MALSPSKRDILRDLTDDQVDYLAFLILQAAEKRELRLRTYATLLFTEPSVYDMKAVPNA